MDAMPAHRWQRVQQCVAFPYGHCAAEAHLQAWVQVPWCCPCWAMLPESRRRSRTMRSRSLPMLAYTIMSKER